MGASLKMSLMAQAQSAVAQKGRDGASFTRRGEGYFGHAVDGCLVFAHLIGAGL
jgi:hypothetical protein